MVCPVIWYGATGMIGPTAPAGITNTTITFVPCGLPVCIAQSTPLVYAISSGIAYTPSERLSSHEAEIIYTPYNEKCRLQIKGNIRQVALLVLQEALRRKELQTYSYIWTTHPPTTVYWGPFSFDVVNDFRCSQSIINGSVKYTDQELQILADILQEIQKLHQLKVFW